MIVLIAVTVISVRVKSQASGDHIRGNIT